MDTGQGMGARDAGHPDLRDGMVAFPHPEQPGGRRCLRYQFHHPVRHRRADPDGLLLFRAERHPPGGGDRGHRHGLRRQDDLRDHPGFPGPAFPAGAAASGDRPEPRPAERQADVHPLRRPDGRHRHRHVHLQRRQLRRDGHHRPHLHQVPERIPGQGDPVPGLRDHPVVPADPLHRPGHRPGDGKAACRGRRAAGLAPDAVRGEGDDGGVRSYPGDGVRPGHRHVHLRFPAEHPAVHPVQAFRGDRRFHHPRPAPGRHRPGRKGLVYPDFYGSADGDHAQNRPEPAPSLYQGHRPGRLPVRLIRERRVRPRLRYDQRKIGLSPRGEKPSADVTSPATVFRSGPPGWSVPLGPQTVPSGTEPAADCLPCEERRRQHRNSGRRAECCRSVSVRQVLPVHGGPQAFPGGVLLPG